MSSDENENDGGEEVGGEDEAGGVVDLREGEEMEEDEN